MSYHDVKIYSGNAVANAKKAYAIELADIKDEKNRSNLASILLNRDMNESGNISLAFYLSRCNDKDAQQDGFRTATSMIEKVTGLKKSMISNYVKVGRFLTNENGMFELPEYARGFSVTQMVEILSKKTPNEFKSMVDDGLIDNTMSAKTLRDACKPDTVIDVESAETYTETAQDATETAQDAKKNIPTDYYLTDSNGNRVAIIRIMGYMNGYTFDGIDCMTDLSIGGIAQ